MPHLVIEFTSNVIEKNNINTLLGSFHPLLEKMLPTDLSSCKSRAVEYNNFFVGDGCENNAFVHMTLKIMSGRSKETLKALGDVLTKHLRSYFANSSPQLNLSISVEIIELSELYFKLI